MFTDFFTVMSNIGGGKTCFTVMLNAGGEKKRGEMNRKKELIKASCFLRVLAWIITVAFKVAGVAFICLS